MKLKIKFLNWSAGLPVAILHQDTAKEIGIFAKDRVAIKIPGSEKIYSTVVDTLDSIIKKNEIVLTSELHESLGIKNHSHVEVLPSPMPNSLVFIKNKLDGIELNQKEIHEILKDIVSNSLSEAEVALFVSAMYVKGMNKKEQIYLIKALSKTGKFLGIKNKIIADKHSIGGIPGNRSTPIVTAICVAAGLTMPKTSSRAITTAAGTADCMEVICHVDFEMDELKKIIQKTGGCIVWGGGLGMVPADSKIIQTEKLLQIDPKAQMIASIMSKKLSVGSTHILIDIPYGKTAKVDKKRALEIQKRFLEIGKSFNKKLKVVLTKGDEPMGIGVGPYFEIRDVINVLDQTKKGPKDLEKKSLLLAGELLELTKKAKTSKGLDLAKEILYSGKAFEKFKEIVKAQKGNVKKIDKIKPAKFSKTFYATKKLRVKEINNFKINSLARVTGCPVDKLSGLEVFAEKSKNLKPKDKIISIYSHSKQNLKQAISYYNKHKPITFY